MATPNDLADISTRIEQAKDFFKEHLDEQLTTAARIFKIPSTTLQSLIYQKPSGKDRDIRRLDQESFCGVVIPPTPPRPPTASTLIGWRSA